MPRSSDVRRRIFAIGDLIANLELWSVNKVEQVIDKQPTPQNRRRTGRSSPIPNGEAHRFAIYGPTHARPLEPGLERGDHAIISTL